MTATTERNLGTQCSSIIGPHPEEQLSKSDIEMKTIPEIRDRKNAFVL
jgi:hypothetical protein